ncbi:MAG: magnesium transport protein CorA [Candidatus Hydrogenedentota bacterium]
MSDSPAAQAIPKHVPRIPGQAPGTIDSVPGSPTPTIRVFAYNDNEFVEETISDVCQLASYLAEWRVTWVHVDGLGDKIVLQQLGTLFEMHRLALEDVVHGQSRPKVEVYGDHEFIVVRMPIRGEVLQTSQLSIVLGPNYVVTFQAVATSCLEPVRERARKESAVRLRQGGPDYLAYCLLDAAIDHYFPFLEEYNDRIDELEDEALTHANREFVTHVHDLRRNLLTVRRAMWPMREVINTMIRDLRIPLSDETRLYLRDCYDHTHEILDSVESYREITSGLLDIYLSSVNYRLNEVMRVLTVFATIFIPLTFITGLYGMNFHTEDSPYNMPELSWRYGYPFALTIMAVTAGSLLYFFWRKGWLGKSNDKDR